MNAESPVSLDPLAGDLRVREYFGDHYQSVDRFATLLAEHGVERGLIGPRELGRLWERHILNSAAVAPFLPAEGTLADIGSGAGLPGMVLAAVEPRRHVVLVEPMERRVAWLKEVVAKMGLQHVQIVRGRAEEVADRVQVDVVTARAVASVTKLVKWCAPLLQPGGEMLFLKGRSVADEIEAAKYALRRAGLVAEIHEAPTIADLEPTRVVRLRPSE